MVFHTEHFSPEAQFLDVTVPPRKEKWLLQKSVPRVQVTEMMVQPIVISQGNVAWLSRGCQ